MIDFVTGLYSSLFDVAADIVDEDILFVLNECMRAEVGMTEECIRSLLTYGLKVSEEMVQITEDIDTISAHSKVCFFHLQYCIIHINICFIGYMSLSSKAITSLRYARHV